ncbi:unannotated protein [freshwater metagenome]|uniref:Unannotated protein n=1 Tax=freshwater metagenome TaxID=449393 RepID=A0A6J6TYD5_9ZZZZ|nr:RDD family protein [Actinomycetota bacterium]MSX20032.1 RDD family protein [Actinomycetota bacterium]MSY93626.1 RDD family protein [Actinomycetota bacterium]
MHGDVSLARRMAAITLDWLASYLIAIVFFSGSGTFLERTAHAGVPALIIFFIEYFLLIALQGASAGHRIFRMKIVNFYNGGRPTILQALIRSLLMVIVITAVTYDENGRGIHERLSKTKIILNN